MTRIIDYELQIIIETKNRKYRLKLKMNEKLMAAVLDDDIVFAQLLKNKVIQVASRHELDFEVFCFCRPYELDICAATFDVLFLDIEFPDQNGIVWIQKWQDKGKFGDVIFVSAYEEYVFQSFESQPIAFVRKMNLEEELDRALGLYKRKRTSLPMLLPISEGKKIHFFDIANIIFLQGCGHYIEFHLRNGEVKVIRGKMNHMEKILGSYGFARIQIRYLVNVKYLMRMDINRVMLTDGNEFNISPQYKALLFQKLKIFLTNDGE